jgi:sarcosine oxidase subunit gamma
MVDAAMTLALRQPATTGLTLPLLTGRVMVSDPGPLTRLLYRGPAAPLGAALEIAVSDEPCRAETRAGVSVLWLGPDERLVIAPDGEAEALTAQITAAAGPTPCAIVDVSHRSAALVLEGPRASRLLNAACPLDLDGERFPPGTCTRTLFGKAEIVLWRTAPDRFHVDVWRSFVPYVTALMTEAGRDIG